MRLRIELSILKREHCCICGSRLKRKITCIYKECTYKPFGIPFLKERKRFYLLLMPVYRCKYCGYLIERVKQKKVSEMQKECGSYLLTDGKNIIHRFKIKEYFDKEVGFYLKK